MGCKVYFLKLFLIPFVLANIFAQKFYEYALDSLIFLLFFIVKFLLQIS